MVHLGKGVMTANGNRLSLRVPEQRDRVRLGTLQQAVRRGVYFRRKAEIGWVAIHKPSGLKIGASTKLRAYLTMLHVCNTMSLKIRKTGLYKHVQKNTVYNPSITSNGSITGMRL